MKNSKETKVYQVVESLWNGDEYDPIKDTPLKTFLHEDAAEKFKQFKIKTKRFHTQAGYSNISYYINTIEVCKDKDFEEPSISEFLDDIEKYRCLK